VRVCVTSAVNDVVDDVTDVGCSLPPTQENGAASSESSSEQQPQRVDIKQERPPPPPPGDQDAGGACDTGECGVARALRYNELALILRLQRDMATMQLQMSNLQDAMRAANATLQLLLQMAFDRD